ncbi:MAG: transcription factor S [Candidatus Aenigmatarchaeota archaeon]|nr:transcription factor S [Candidatus Aenigmarchaeota archaeon]
MPEFCKCGGLLVPTKKGKKIILVCRKCNKKITKFKKSSEKIFETEIKKIQPVIVVEKKKQIEDVLPKINIECPKCKNKEAYWWVQQASVEEEKNIRFYKCTKCKYTWREEE